MALQDTHSEPSMEDILASIRRIISEDEPQDSKADEPLELSQPAPAPPESEPSNDLLIFDRQPEPEAWAPPPKPAPAPLPPMEPDEPLMSEPVVSAAAGSFTRLAGTLRIADAQGQTLEGIVRELLRPMLRDWLEQNLPALVEAKVEAELDRIARLSR